MSFCVRTIPNKLTSFVNTRKQATKIDRQLRKSVKSTFLDEFLHLSSTANPKFNLKETNLEVPVLQSSQPNLLLYYTHCSELNESLGKKKIQKKQLPLNSDEATVHQSTNVLVDDSLVLFSKSVCDSLKTDPSVLSSEIASPREQTQSNEGVDGKPSQEQLEKVFQQLSNDLPKFFVQPLNYSIYDPNIIFINNIRGVNTEGLVHYISQLGLLKTVGHLKFAYVSMEVMKITMHPEDGTIKVRWRINGISGAKMFFKFWKVNFFNIKESLTDKDVWIDGFSTYYVNSKGKIYKHIADKMMPDQDKIYENEKTPVITKLAMFISLTGLETFQCSDILQEIGGETIVMYPK